VRTLLVDDDPAFRRLATIALDAAGVESEVVGTATAALKRLDEAERPFDLILLDQELPGMSGAELLDLLRKRGHDIPVVLVTIRDAAEDRIRALRLGADDYLVKPFRFEELLARLRAVTRRSLGDRPVRIGTLEIDPRARHVTRAGEPVPLTQREFEVLWVLVQAQERTVTRKEFLRRVWGMSFEPETNFIQVHISRLRTKLGPLEGKHIQTVRGQGYRMANLTAAPHGLSHERQS